MNERKRVCESVCVCVCVCCSQRKSQYCSVRLLWETVGEEGSFGDSGIEAMLPDEATLNSMPK